MNHPRVVNIYKNVPFEVYIGRAKSPLHWGNPFSHKEESLAKVKVATREEAIIAFNDWIKGFAHHDIEPERREWMIRNLPNLRGKTLGCYCAPLACHGDVLAQLADESQTPVQVKIDPDLYAMSRDQLIAEVMKGRTAARKHRDQRGDDRCWLDDEELYKSLPEGYTPPERDTSVELKLCEKYICNRRNPATQYISPQRRIEELEKELEGLKK